MLRMLLLITMVLGLYVLLNPPVLIIADLPALPPQIEVVAKPGVSHFETETVKRALRLAANMLENEVGLKLHHTVTVILAPNLFSYYGVLTNEEGLDHNSALFQASASAGTTRDTHIVINCGATPNYNDMIFIAAHELTHQYQFETVGEWSRNNWFTEGMADVVAASVVGINQGNRKQAIDDYKHSWIMQLRKAAPSLPDIGQLDKRQDWFHSFQKFHTLPYRYSAMAVFSLVDEKGLKALGDYIQLRNRGVGAEDAFEKAFKQSLPAFFNSQDGWLKQETNERHYDIKAGNYPDNIRPAV